MREPSWGVSAAVVAALICPGALPTAAVAAAHPEPQFPRTPEGAIALHESEVGKWAEGPTRLLILEDEKKIWERLETDDERRRFIGWFWNRRDNDLRDDENAARQGFYTRVAQANSRFHSIPRGWRTDQGRVWVLLGPPDRINSDFDDRRVAWGYFVPGLDRVLGGFTSAGGDLTVHFARNSSRSFRIDGGVGPGAWPLHIMRLIEYLKAEMVLNPDLEFPGA